MSLREKNTDASDCSDPGALRARGEALAREALGLSYSAALERLDNGQLRGTILESELKMIRFLLEGEELHPLAAE